MIIASYRRIVIFTNGDTISRVILKCCETVADRILRGDKAIIVDSHFEDFNFIDQLCSVIEQKTKGVRPGEKYLIYFTSPVGICKRPFEVWFDIVGSCRKINIANVAASEVVALGADVISASGSMSGYLDSGTSAASAFVLRVISGMLRLLESPKIDKYQELERTIIDQLTKTMKNTDRAIFLLDGFFDWTEQDVALLEGLIRDHCNPDNSNSIIVEKSSFVLIGSSKGNSKAAQFAKSLVENQPIKTTAIPMPELSPDEVAAALRERGYSEHLSLDALEALCNLANNDIGLINDLAFALQGEPRFKIGDQEVYELAQKISNSLFDMVSNGHLSEENCRLVIQLASLFDVEISEIELDGASGLAPSEFHNIIERAADKKVLRKAERQEHLMFSQEFIRVVIRAGIGDKRADYYGRLEHCLAKLKPHLFGRRAYYALWSGNCQKAHELFVLELLDQAWQTGCIDYSTEAKLLELSQCIELGADAYIQYSILRRCIEAYQNRDYSYAQELLKTIDHTVCSPSFAVYQATVQAYVDSKFLDAKTRLESVDTISRALARKHIEPSIREHALLRAVTVYTHAGKSAEASQAMQELIESTSQRQQYDINARRTTHIAYRIYNTVFSDDISLGRMQAAAKFFEGPGRNMPDALQQQYKALTNLSASYCDNGHFKESFTTARKLLELEDGNKNAVFARPEIGRNTLLVSGFLSKSVSPIQCAEAYQQLMKALAGLADNVFFRSNYAIMLLFSGKHNEAISELRALLETDALSNDVEGLYRNRVITNLASCLYLTGNRIEARELMLGLSASDFGGSNAKLMRRRWEKMKAWMNQDIECTNPEVWLHNFHDAHCTLATMRNPAYYYMLGFQFSTTYTWDA